MATWSSFYPFVMPHAKGAPSSLANTALRNAAREFCRKSAIWRDDITGVFIVEGQRTYKLTPPSSSRIVALTTIRYDGTPMFPASEDLLDYRTGGGQWHPAGFDSSNDQHVWYAYNLLYVDGDYIRIAFDPPAEDTGKLFDPIRAILMPEEDSGSFPDWLYDDWASAIAAGALFELLEMEGERWANVKRSQRYLVRFRAAINQAYGYATRSGTRGTLRVKFPHFASGGRNF